MGVEGEKRHIHSLVVLCVICTGPIHPATTVPSIGHPPHPPSPVAAAVWVLLPCWNKTKLHGTKGTKGMKGMKGMKEVKEAKEVKEVEWRKRNVWDHFALLHCRHCPLACLSKNLLEDKAAKRGGC